MNAVNMLNWAPRVGFVCVGSPPGSAPSDARFCAHSNCAPFLRLLYLLFFLFCFGSSSLWQWLVFAFFLFQLNICYIFKRHICIESCLGNVLPLNFANPYRQRVLIDSHVKTDSKINTRKRICNWIGFWNCRISVRYTTRHVRNYFFLSFWSHAILLQLKQQTTKMTFSFWW